MGHILQVAVLGHVHGRVRPVPGIVGAVVGIKHIVAGLLQIAGGLFAFLHIPADLGVVGLAGQGTVAEILHLGHGAVPHRYRVIRPAGRLDGLDDLHRKAVAVLKIAAVGVGAVVGVFHGKLVQQVAFVYRMDLHAVHPGFLAQNRRFGKGFDDLLDLGDRHLGAGDLRCPAGRQRAGAGQLIVGIQNGLDQGAQHGVLVQGQHLVGNAPGPAHTRGDLHKQLGAGLVDLFHVGFQFPEHLFVLVKPPAADGVPDGGNAGDDQAHIVAGPLQEEVGRFFVKMVWLHPAEQRGAAHGAEDDPVLDLYLADLPGGKKRFIGLLHAIASFLCRGRRGLYQRPAGRQQFLSTVYHLPRFDTTETGRIYRSFTGPERR